MEQLCQLYSKTLIALIILWKLPCLFYTVSLSNVFCIPTDNDVYRTASTAWGNGAALPRDQQGGQRKQCSASSLVPRGLPKGQQMSPQLWSDHGIPTFSQTRKAQRWRSQVIPKDFPLRLQRASREQQDRIIQEPEKNPQKLQICELHWAVLEIF